MSLISHYRLNGDATDSVGGNDGTATNVSWVDGKLGQAGDFDGEDSTVGLGQDSFEFITKKGIYSFTAWVNIRDSGRRPQIISKSNGGADRNVLGIQNDQFVFGYYDGSSWNRAPSTSVTLNEWVHLAGVNNRGTLTLYVNGVSGGGSQNPYTATHRNLAISGPNAKIDGLIDDVRIYDHALSPREVRDLSLGTILQYSFNTDNENKVTDSSGQGNDAELDSNAPQWIEESAIGNGSYEFIDRENWIEIPEITSDDLYCVSDNEWSTSIWFKHFGRSDNGIDSIIGASGGFGGSATYAIGVDEQDRLRVTLRGNSSYPASNVSDEEWHHIAITWDGSDAVAFFDNNQPVSLSVGTASSQERGLAVGSHTVGSPSGGTNGDPFHGLIDNPKVYTTQLSEQQVKELYEQRASIDSEGSFHSKSIVETKPEDSSDPPSGYTQYTILAQPHPIDSSTPTARISDSDGNRIPDIGRGSDGRWERDWNIAVWDLQKNDWATITNWPTPIRRSTDRYAVYDTYSNDGHEPAFAEAIRMLKNPRYIVIVVASHAPERHSEDMRTALKELGAQRIDELPAPNTDRFTYILVVQYGYAPFIEKTDNVTYDSYDNCTFTYMNISNKQMEITDSGTFSSYDMSEIGVIKGAVGWWPLIKDTKDYVDTNDATTSGGGLIGAGYEVIDNSDGIETDLIPDYEEFSYTFWAKVYDFASVDNWDHILGNATRGQSGGFNVYNGSRDDRWRLICSTNDSDGNRENIQMTIHTKNVWVFITVTHKNGISTGYLDGEQQQERSTGYATRDDNFFIKRPDNRFEGAFADCRVYNRALSDEEVAILYEMTDPESTTKVKQTPGMVYTKGQIIEH